ncbi:unnamed protein product [Calicophoron daubneyi]|uniref:Uncharacterized protein n=1 Tax=Calicophoron daubneyi TaxID=300641 RepID=A0AAV2TCR5_CALDB
MPGKTASDIQAEREELKATLLRARSQIIGLPSADENVKKICQIEAEFEQHEHPKSWYGVKQIEVDVMLKRMLVSAEQENHDTVSECGKDSDEETMPTVDLHNQAEQKNAQAKASNNGNPTVPDPVDFLFYLLDYEKAIRGAFRKMWFTLVNKDGSSCIPKIPEITCSNEMFKLAKYLFRYQRNTLTCLDNLKMGLTYGTKPVDSQRVLGWGTNTPLITLLEQFKDATLKEQNYMNDTLKRGFSKMEEEVQFVRVSNAVEALKEYCHTIINEVDELHPELRRIAASWKK